MFNHQTILSLRPALDTSAALPVFGHFRDYHFARNVMEAKRHLLRCLHNQNQSQSATPDIILVDAGRDSRDIRTELERWLEAHPRLGRVQVRLPERGSWLGRLWPWTRHAEHSTATN